MSEQTESVQNKSGGAAVLPLAALLYLFFVLSYVWFLPNYNLLRFGGRVIAGSHATFKTGTRLNNFNAQADKGVWLEKISKTTPETKRGIGFMLTGVLATVFTILYAPRIFSQGAFIYGQNRGHGIFAHQYAYLSLRMFRI
ncbi:MAG: hypothetical protein JSU01_23035 [Bacteroidetes bacterium]|nr:hypothetical protein [Bacteroidota bacterium]